MSPARFVLAVPHADGPDPAHPPEVVASVGEFCRLRARLWVDRDLPVLTLDGMGYVLGPVFSRASMAAPAWSPPDRTLRGDAVDLADWLIRECWGAYCAILLDGRANALKIVVDPSGLMPVYRLDLLHHSLVASDPSLLFQASGTAPNLCWPSLKQHLLRPELRTRSTCLRGIKELAPGELACLSRPGVPAHRVWKAESHLPGRRAHSFEDAAEELRHIAKGVLGVWADWFGSVAVAASGGVDSSLICAALSQISAPFGCITVSTADQSGDELRHVELLARHLDVPLSAQRYDGGSFDPQCAASIGLPRPSRKSFLRSLDAALYRGADDLGASTIFDGNGGDNLFCFLHSATPVADRFLECGIGAGSWNTLLDMCRITGCDVSAMVPAVGRRLRRGGRAAPWPVDARLLEDPHDPAVPQPLQPWLDIPVGRHFGKRDHLALIMRVQNQVHDLASAIPRFSPLMSQPLLEFCLGVPTWQWCRGGTNRALARAAFSHALPPQTLARTSKAGPDSFIRSCFEAHRATLREMLLGGAMADQGLLDRDATERALHADVHCDDPIVYRLLDLAEAEAWSRSWIS